MRPQDWDTRREYKERGDCTVRAMVWATGRSYAEMHALAKKHGRRDRNGFWLNRHINAMMKEIGFQCRLVKRSGSLGSAIKKNPDKTMLAIVTGHAVAVRDGIVKSDLFARPMRRVMWAWVCEPVTA